MDAKQVIKQSINQANIMQLATSLNDVPWVVTVHFYADDELNLYWCSRDSRRHSREIGANPHAAATILVHENTEQEDWVIGITASGTAELVENLDDSIAQAYIKKLLKDPELPAKIAAGSVPDKWYRLKPSSIILFDTKNFPASPRQEITL